jgi:hypothetical protein
MIIFKIDIAYVSNLAHACLQVYSANSNILGLAKVGRGTKNPSLEYQKYKARLKMLSRENHILRLNASNSFIT